MDESGGSHIESAIRMRKLITVINREGIEAGRSCPEVTPNSSLLHGEAGPAWSARLLLWPFPATNRHLFGATDGQRLRGRVTGNR